MEFKCLKLVKIIVFRWLRAKKNNQLAAQGMRDWEGQQALFKENENKWINKI